MGCSVSQNKDSQPSKEARPVSAKKELKKDIKMYYQRIKENQEMIHSIEKQITKCKSDGVRRRLLRNKTQLEEKNMEFSLHSDILRQMSSTGVSISFAH